jgi:hypothetical protein
MELKERTMPKKLAEKRNNVWFSKEASTKQEFMRIKKILTIFGMAQQTYCPNGHKDESPREEKQSLI